MPREEKAQGELCNVYKCQMGLSEENGTRLFLSGVQGKENGQWSQTEIQKIPFIHLESLEILRVLLQSWEIGRETLCP